MSTDESGGRLAALKAAVGTFGEAWARGDVAVLDRMLAPGYTHHDASGARLGRADWLDYAGKRTGRATTIGFHDVSYRLFGDVAVVTGRNVIMGGGAAFAGDTRDLEIVFTQVWIRSGGRWLREAFQATPVVEQGFA